MIQVPPDSNPQPLSVLTFLGGSTIVSSSTGLTSGSHVSFLTFTANPLSILTHITTRCEVIGSDRQRTCTDQTVCHCALCCITMISWLTLFTLITQSIVLTILGEEEVLLLYVTGRTSECEFQVWKHDFTVCLFESVNLFRNTFRIVRIWWYFSKLGPQHRGLCRAFKKPCSTPKSKLHL